VIESVSMTVKCDHVRTVSYRVLYGVSCGPPRGFVPTGFHTHITV